MTAKIEKDPTSAANEEERKLVDSAMGAEESIPDWMVEEWNKDDLAFQAIVSRLEMAGIIDSDTKFDTSFVDHVLEKGVIKAQYPTENKPAKVNKPKTRLIRQAKPGK